jgi:hypothetical protein
MLVTIPILTELQKTLDAGPTGDLTFIATVSGQPMTKVGLDNRFQEACDAAGVKKSAHGIRKAAARRAANNGATTAQMNSIFGWEGDAMASLYTKSAKPPNSPRAQLRSCRGPKQQHLNPHLSAMWEL